jgi:hypothetical protein
MPGLTVCLGRVLLGGFTGQVDWQASVSVMMLLNSFHMPGLFMKQAAPPPRISWWPALLMSAMQSTCTDVCWLVHQNVWCSIAEATGLRAGMPTEAATVHCVG